MPKKTIEYLKEADQILSRTSSGGSVDTSVNEKKKGPSLSGADLLRQVNENRELASRYIESRRGSIPSSGFEHCAVLCTLAEIAGLSILGSGLFRRWEYLGYKEMKFQAPVAPDQIPQCLGNLMERVALIGKQADQEMRLAEIAIVEWELGIGPLHPFYDGCGRISRYHSTILSLWFDVPLVIHKSRDQYFAAARAGVDEFTRYFLACGKEHLAPGPN